MQGRNSSRLRVVVLTGDPGRGRTMVDALTARGVVVAGVVIEAATALEQCRRARTNWGRLLETPIAIARSVRRRLRAHALRARGRPLVVIADRRSPAARAALARLAPDLLVLSAIGIVDDDVLAIPRLGTLNGHPALLPWIRGNGVVRHSLRRGVAVGATCHRVDAGIDTGPVLERRLLPIAGSEPLASIERAAIELAMSMTADVAADAFRNGHLPAGAPQRVRYPLCRWHDAGPRSPAGDEALAREGARLFRVWRSLCTDDRWRLPQELDPSALPAIGMTPAATPAT